MNRMEEQFLVEKAQKNLSDFDAVYRAFIEDIYRFVFYRTNSPEDAQDITSQVFMKALEQLHTFQYRPGARFSSWLYAIARNRIIDYYRQHKPMAALEDVAELSIPEEASGTLDIQFNAKRIHRILTQLSDDDQELLILRLWQNKTYAEMAGILGVSAIALRARYSRALKKFKQLYQQ